MTPTPPRPARPAGPPPSGPPPSTPPPQYGQPAGPGGGGFQISWKALAVALLVVIVGLGTVVAVVALSGDDEAEAEELTVEPVSSPGDNPFAPPVGTDESGVTPPQGSGTTVSGDTVGLYGGTLNYTQCDPQQLITFLQQNAAQGRAWAQVQGISYEQIATYVAELTPVILRSDTYVINHGFVNGSANPIPAVLQAGTAVMVDKYGVPRVKCYCGNPLTRWKSYPKVRYTGPRWSGFDPGQITIIQQTTVVIQIFTLVDPKTGEGFTRPAGSTGGSDEPTGQAPTPEPPDTQPPPNTRAPVPQTQAPIPNAEDEAIAKVQRASSECYPFPAPIEDSNEPPNIYTQPGNDDSYFVLIADGTTVTGNFQEFIWHVDRATLAFTPQNNFAQVASDHCPGLR